MRIIRASRAAQGMIACLVMMSVVGVVLLVLFAKQRLTKPSRVDVPLHPAEHPAEHLAAKYEGGPGASSAEYIEAGRLLLKAGLAQQAALWLFRAYQQGDRTPLLRHLLAEAIRVAAAAAVRLPLAGVTDGALSSDGRLAAVVDKDGILTLHEAESGQLLETLSDTEPDDQSDPAESVVFLRDGKHLLSVHKPDETHYTIRRWRQPQPGAPFENEYEIDCPDVGSGSLERLMLTPDEHYLLMHADGSWEGASWSELVLYDLTTGNPVRDSVERGVPHEQGSELSVAAAALCRDGSRILIIDSAMESRSDPSTEESSQEPSDLTAVKIIDTASGKLIGKISERDTGIVQAQLSPDMQRLLTLNRRGEVKVWQVDSGKRLFALDLQKTRTASSSFRPDWVEAHSRVFKLTARGGLELHDELRGKIDLKAARADRAQYVADGSLIAVSMITGELIHWDARTGVCRSTRCGADSSTADEFGSTVAALAEDVVSLHHLAKDRDTFSAVTTGQIHGRKLIIQSGSAWITKQPPQSSVIPIPDGDTLARTAVSRDGAYVLHFGRRKEVTLWSAATGKVLQRWPLPGLFRGEPELGLASDGQRVAFALPPVWSSETRANQPVEIKLWDAASGRQYSFSSGTEHIKQIAFSTSSAQLATRTESAINIHALTGGQLVHTYKERAARYLQWSPDDKRLLVQTAADVKVIEVATGKEVRSWENKASPPTALAWTPDGRFLVMAGRDGTARVEAVEPAQSATGPAATFAEHHGAISEISFSPDGELMLTRGTDQTVRVWERRSGRQLRQFTSGEPAFLTTRIDEKGEALRALGMHGVMRWDIRPESRPPEEIAVWLKCHVSYRFEGRTLSPLPAGEPLPAACWPR